jgi:hypothetical protein
MRNLTSSVEGIPLEHSFFRNKVLVVWVPADTLPGATLLPKFPKGPRACVLCPRVTAAFFATVRGVGASCLKFKIGCNLSLIARCRCHSSYQTHRMGKPPSTRQALWMSRS